MKHHTLKTDVVLSNVSKTLRNKTREFQSTVK